MSVTGADKPYEFTEGHDAGGVEVTGVFQAKDDYFDIRINDESLDLGLEKFGGPKKERTFNMDDGNCRVGAFLFLV
jgi:hypothetical protein